jgi:5-methylcytosine-specific restriction endonuclease McrA
MAAGVYETGSKRYGGVTLMKTPQNILDRIKKWKHENKQKVLAGQKAYRERNRELLNEKSRKYNLESKDKKLESNRKYKERNKEKTLEYNREYRKNNPEVAHEYYLKTKERDHERRAACVRNRRARRNYIEGKITSSEWIDLKEKYGNKCLCCGRTDVKLELDHVIPLAIGGEHNINNAQPLCRSCNGRKHIQIKDYRHECD